MALWLLCCATLLSSCVSAPPPTVTQVERVKVPEELLACPNPVLPESVTLQSQVALLLVDLQGALDECRGKLAAIRTLNDDRRLAP